MLNLRKRRPVDDSPLHPCYRCWDNRWWMTELGDGVCDKSWQESTKLIPPNLIMFYRFLSIELLGYACPSKNGIITPQNGRIGKKRRRIKEEQRHRQKQKWRISSTEHQTDCLCLERLLPGFLVMSWHMVTWCGRFNGKKEEKWAFTTHYLNEINL